MKTTNILYWVFTVLLAGFMIFSALPNIMETKDSEALFKQLGYPLYLQQFVGIAKLLGSIVILIPAFPRLKEWAYAGLFFDLTGAAYSCVASGEPLSVLGFFVVFIAVLFLSYYFHHKRLRQKQSH
ncbi:DoxX family protein [Mucilaginibacter limnophilus]|uniref:DoxX family protein n=1 Tax=Mucilaginibacter limnophilus TaxID=1932778 RepID=A0A437MUU7_9SPHI|nr:DoxX family protein [Mucilaginibacter limnophilus]RVU01407.1 DoxX family protein [Mucilaginibacter limnophilus]